MIEIQMWATWMRSALTDAKTERDEKGAVSMEAMILIAIMAAAAIGVGVIVTAKVYAKANSIPTD